MNYFKDNNYYFTLLNSSFQKNYIFENPKNCLNRENNNNDKLILSLDKLNSIKILVSENYYYFNRLKRKEELIKKYFMKKEYILRKNILSHLVLLNGYTKVKKEFLQMKQKIKLKRLFLMICFKNYFFEKMIKNIQKRQFYKEIVILLYNSKKILCIKKSRKNYLDYICINHKKIFFKKISKIIKFKKNSYEKIKKIILTKKLRIFRKKLLTMKRFRLFISKIFYNKLIKLTLKINEDNCINKQNLKFMYYLFKKRIPFLFNHSENINLINQFNKKTHILWFINKVKSYISSKQIIKLLKQKSENEKKKVYQKELFKIFYFLILDNSKKFKNQKKDSLKKHQYYNNMRLKKFQVLNENLKSNLMKIRINKNYLSNLQLKKRELAASVDDIKKKINKFNTNSASIFQKNLEEIKGNFLLLTFFRVKERNIKK